MKRNLFILAIVSLAFVIGCQKEDFKEESQAVVNGNEEVIPFELPEPIEFPEFVECKLPESTEKWGGTPHSKLMFIAAKYWKLSDSRANRMAAGAPMPDQHDNEGTIPGTQQWRHGYIYLYGYYTGIGVADAMCANNINGSGYNKRSAFYYYPSNKWMGDWYLGYAAHYLQDVANPWHTSANIYQQLATHNGYENWVSANWDSGHNFESVVNADKYYYSVTNPAAAVRYLALWSNYRNTTIYDAYVASGKPTGLNGGNDALIEGTKELLIAACRYSKGLIKHTLDAENAW
ncbi:MAG: hypothetical protein ACOX0M_08820 [Salinivirgaceae bacterium]|jgi:hypothetical protein|nr:hypothetical protein [Bacteroidales bacterium]